MRVITLEEHFWTGALATPTARYSQAGKGESWPITSATSGRAAWPTWTPPASTSRCCRCRPAAQELDPAAAVPLARDANDQLAAAVAAHPDRFAGFATLPTAGSAPPRPRSWSAP